MNYRNPGLIIIGAFALAGIAAGCGGTSSNDETSTTAPAAPTKTAAAPATGVNLGTAAPASNPVVVAKAKAAGAPLTCPVTGNKIASMDKAVGHSSYKGKQYYFCCSECKPKFDKNPATYVANAAKGKYEAM